MRLADDEITIKVGAETVCLRPTLRAAFRLERRHGGFDRIIRAVLDGSLTVIADVITESSVRWTSVPDFLKSIDAMPMKSVSEHLAVQVLNHVLVLAGLNEKARDKIEPSTDRMTFAAYHTKLFQIATGWLAWTPEQAWNATA